MDSDNVNWSAIPKINEPGCSWTEHSEKDEPRQIMPLNCYGNYMISRNEWIELNGCDEVFTNNEHWEDQDFCIRAKKFGSHCSRFSKKMFRLHHYYGSHSGRSNIKPDYQFKSPCDSCNKAQYTYAPNRFDIKNRIDKGEIEIFEEDQIWVCKNCHLSCTIWHNDVSESYRFIENKKSYKSTIIPKYKIGRNLAILVEDMRGKSLQEKIEIYIKRDLDCMRCTVRL
jgi:GT2 family glycosyltransferase